MVRIQDRLLAFSTMLGEVGPTTRLSGWRRSLQDKWNRSGLPDGAGAMDRGLSTTAWCRPFAAQGVTAWIAYLAAAIIPRGESI